MTDQTPRTKRSLLGWVAILAPLAAFAALAAIFATQLTSGRDNSELPSAFIGKTLPSFELPPLPGLKREGKPLEGITSDKLRGSAHLVNIFASWCAPCRAEHPVLMQLVQRNDLSIVGVNYKDDPGNALRFLGGLGNPYTQVGIDPAGRTAIDLGFYGIPETLLVDSKGIVRHKIVGPITKPALDRLIKEIAAINGD